MISENKHFPTLIAWNNIINKIESILSIGCSVYDRGRMHRLITTLDLWMLKECHWYTSNMDDNGKTAQIFVPLSWHLGHHFYLSYSELGHCLLSEFLHTICRKFILTNKTALPKIFINTLKTGKMKLKSRFCVLARML